MPCRPPYLSASAQVSRGHPSVQDAPTQLSSDVQCQTGWAFPVPSQPQHQLHRCSPYGQQQRRMTHSLWHCLPGRDTQPTNPPKQRPPRLSLRQPWPSVPSAPPEAPSQSTGTVPTPPSPTGGRRGGPVTLAPYLQLAQSKVVGANRPGRSLATALGMPPQKPPLAEERQLLGRVLVRVVGAVFWALKLPSCI